MKFAYKQMLVAVLITVCFCFSPANAAHSAKRTLKGNMTEVYRLEPADTSSFGGMFSEGIFYGRIRTNSFLWNWEKEVDGKTRDNWSMGIGGSMILKSASLHGASFTAGLYTSSSPWHMGGDDYRYAKAGKDAFSRYQAATSDDYNMAVLAQAYLEYRFLNSSVRAGRQIFESLLTASNDTKMIPQTFEGITLESSDVKNTQVKVAWLHRQKLRDHTSFHHVLAFGDDPDNPYAGWTENDDSSMHKGLKLSRLKAAGIDDELYILQVQNTSIPNLTIMANMTDVPDLVGLVTGEVNYTVPLPGDIKLVPGARYLVQTDHGGGRIGGASLAGKITTEDARGYTDSWSLDGTLFALRINISKGATNFLLGYSKISDDADIVAPWRGFPTNGYTRAMGQYDWYANTETIMLQAGYDLSKAGLVPGFSVKAKYAIQNFDDLKPDISADKRVLNIDFLEKVKAVPGLEIKLRTAFAWGDSDTVAMNGALKTDPSYNEFRFEMNYLF